MEIKNILDFLNELKINNNREWFQQNKKRYDQIKSSMHAFLKGLIPQVATFDPEVSAIKPEECMFRIYRDVRFSNDKSPYKTQIGAFVSKTGRKGNHPGYYFHLEPGQSFLAGGLYMPPPEVLKAVRSEVYYNVSEFKAILQHPDFVKYFGQPDDFDKLTRPPKGFDSNWPDIDLLKYRSYVVTHNLNEMDLLNLKTEELAMPVFRAMHPLNVFLKKAMDNSKS